MTVSKHRQIAHAATEVFIANGYAETSVDQIASRAGVSKQTVYKHFGSKEKLFLAVTKAATDAVTDELAAQLEARRPDALDFAIELETFARTLARGVLTPEMTALRRLVIAEVPRFPELGRAWYRHGAGRVVEQLTKRFGELKAQGRLAIGDHQRAAEDFNWLVLSAAQNKMMFGTVQRFSDADLDSLATRAVKVFLSGHGVRPHQQERAAAAAPIGVSRRRLRSSRRTTDDGA
jgi:AcrR family transcriptional regulator